MARRYPDDDPLRHVRSHSEALTVGLSVQRHHQHEVPAGTEDTAQGHDNQCYECDHTECRLDPRPLAPLVGVRFALLPHVICCGFAEVEPPHCDLGDLLWGQRDPERRQILNERTVAVKFSTKVFGLTVLA